MLGLKPLKDKGWLKGRALERQSVGTNVGAGTRVGTSFDASVEESVMDHGSVLYFKDSKFFGNLMTNHHEFVRQYPEVVLEFLSAFEYRSLTPGFPEFPLQNAFESTIETMFKDEPTERS